MRLTNPLTIKTMIKFLDTLFVSIGKFPHDKVLHFVCGMLFFLFSAFPILALFGKSWIAYIVGLVLVALMAHLKEVRDCKGDYSAYDWRDFVATIIGGIVASFSIVLVWSKF